MDIKALIDNGKIIKDQIDSPEFKAAVQTLKDLDSNSTADEKVNAVKGIIPFMLPVGEFAKGLLNKKGDSVVDEITEVLTAIMTT